MKGRTTLGQLEREEQIEWKVEFYVILANQATGSKSAPSPVYLSIITISFITNRVTNNFSITKKYLRTTTTTTTCDYSETYKTFETDYFTLYSDYVYHNSFITPISFFNKYIYR